jgi:ATP-binding cassette subfamily F protein 3
MENGKESSNPKGWKTKEQKRLEAEARQSVSKERSRLEKEIESLEKEIDAREARKKELEEILSNPQNYQKGEQIVVLHKEYQVLRKDIDAAYSAWEKAKLAYEELLNELKSISEP